MGREKLGSRIGFILLSAGCAIGVGNVWKFPQSKWTKTTKCMIQEKIAMPSLTLKRTR